MAEDAIECRTKLQRVWLILYSATFVFAVLMSFPSVQPEVLLLSFCLTCLMPDSRLQVCLFLATPILIALKLPYFSIGLLWMLLLQVVVGLILLNRLRQVEMTTKARLTTRCALFAWCCSWFVYTLDDSFASHCSRWREFDQQRSVACLGDSLTDYGYPQELQKIIDLRVEDFGFDGIETKDGVELIPRIDQVDPQIVIIELGGHDYNKGKSRSVAEQNLRILIRHFQGKGIAVVLVEIPRGFISDPYFGLERQLAREYDLELIPDTLIRRFIFWSPIAPPGIWSPKSSHLSIDGLHPNQKGNNLFAAYVKQAIDRIGQLDPSLTDGD